MLLFKELYNAYQMFKSVHYKEKFDILVSSNIDALISGTFGYEQASDEAPDDMTALLADLTTESPQQLSPQEKEALEGPRQVWDEGPGTRTPRRRSASPG